MRRVRCDILYLLLLLWGLPLGDSIRQAMEAAAAVLLHHLEVVEEEEAAAEEGPAWCMRAGSIGALFVRFSTPVAGRLVLERS